MVKSDNIEEGSYVFISRVKELVALKERALGRTIENREIAEEINVSEHTVGKWMRPREFKTADAGILGAFARYFSVEWHTLLMLKPTPKPAQVRRGRPANQKMEGES